MPVEFDPVDVAIGARVRAARAARRLSQGDLGTAIGVTFQQVQKYERGANRISAATLLRISRVLGRQITWFFESGPDEAKSQIEPDAVLAERAFSQIHDPVLRRRILNILQSLARLGN